MLRNSEILPILSAMVTFHELIKTRTNAAHQMAEEAPFISELMGGGLTAGAYLDYLRALEPVYRRMEELFRAHSNEAPFSYFDHRALDRAELITADISFLEGAFNVSRDVRELPSVQAYLEILDDEISPVRLAAHHYIRYLGDLSGGQAIASLVNRHYQIPKEALNFYNFEGIGDGVFYKKRYRDFLNLIKLSQSEREEFLNEVEILYSMNRNVFLDLGSYHKQNMVNA